jgi:hypothetical protein
MASLNNAFLSIQMLNSQTASVVVNVDVVFGPNEVPFAARLDCRVLGRDLLRDDFLFAFNTQFFSPFDTNASNRFQRDVPRSMLDEDRVGADDIVAELTLTLENTTKIRKRTNVVSV